VKDNVFAITSISVTPTPLKQSGLGIGMISISKPKMRVELTVEGTENELSLDPQPKITTAGRLVHPWSDLVNLLKNMTSELLRGDQKVLGLSHGDFLTDYKFIIPDDIFRIIHDHIDSLDPSTRKVLTAIFKICGYIDPRSLVFKISSRHTDNWILELGHLDDEMIGLRMKPDQDFESNLVFLATVLHCKWFGLTNTPNISKEEIFEWYHFQYFQTDTHQNLPSQWKDYLDTKLENGEVSKYNPDLLADSTAHLLNASQQSEGTK